MSPLIKILTTNISKNCVQLSHLFIINIHFFWQFSLQNKLFSTIQLYWQKYQRKMLDKVTSIREGITIAGDGRHDSMGHSAKFGAYTIFCYTVPMTLHFSLEKRERAFWNLAARTRSMCTWEIFAGI